MENHREASILKNILRVLSSNFLVAILGFISSFIFPRILTIDAYALYHTFTLYIGYIGILHLGFPSGMVIKYAGKHYDGMDKRQYKSEIFLVLLILTCFTLLFASISIIMRNRMVAFVACAIIPVCIINSYRSLCQSWSEFKLYTRISTILAIAVPLLALLYFCATKNLPGEVYIVTYLIVYWIVTICLLIRDWKFFRGIKRNRFFTKTNYQTEKIGLALVLGNYINVLFLSVDKQFIKIYFGITEFAFYSFGMSMQNLMTVFITSIAQPLFPVMAQGKLNDEEYNKVKNLLIVFGSFSGCAYFATSFIVKHFIQKYIGSLEIVGIYFLVFPALAVINCLYINLYKIKRMLKQYIITLVSILFTAVLLNVVFIHYMQYYTGVAIATTITYFIWFTIGFFQFKFLKLTFKDITYLIIYMIAFLKITRGLGDIIGFATYFMFIFLLATIFYKNELVNFILKKRHVQKLSCSNE